MVPPVSAVALEPAARDAAIAEIRSLIGERLSTAPSVREQHGKDESYHPSVAPDVVAFAKSTEDVVAIVNAAMARPRTFRMRSSLDRSGFPRTAPPPSP